MWLTMVIRCRHGCLCGDDGCSYLCIGGLLNVRINLTSIQDEVFVGMMRKKADELEANAIRVEQKLLDWVKTKL